MAAWQKAREILETIKHSHFTDPQFIAWAPEARWTCACRFKVKDILKLVGIGAATWWLVQVGITNA